MRDAEASGCPPLSRLELRIEHLNRLSDIEDEFLKRLYDRRSVGEQYCSGGQLNLHVHFRASEGMWCAEYRKRQAVEIGIFSKDINCCDQLPTDANEFPVCVWVTEGLESSRPIASFVRLQPLNCCDMSLVDTLEPTLLLPPHETLFRAFDWKLRSILRDAGIIFGKFKNDIIESALQVITNFPDKNRNSDGGFNANWQFNVAQELRIGINGDNVVVIHKRSESQPQIGKVFSCPPCSFGSAIERMNDRASDIILTPPV